MAQGVVRGQKDANAPCIAYDRRADFQEAHPDCGSAGSLKLRAAQGHFAQPLQQRVGHGGEQQPELVGRESVTAGASASRLHARLKARCLAHCVMAELSVRCYAKVPWRLVRQFPLRITLLHFKRAYSKSGRKGSCSVELFVVTSRAALTAGRAWV